VLRGAGGTRRSEPLLDNVSVAYLPRNVAPEVFGHNRSASGRSLVATASNSDWTQTLNRPALIRRSSGWSRKRRRGVSINVVLEPYSGKEKIATTTLSNIRCITAL